MTNDTNRKSARDRFGVRKRRSFKSNKKRMAVAKMNEWALATKTEVTNEEIEKEIEGAYNGLK